MPSARITSARTKLVTLLGNPVSHSLSPLIHNTAFEAAGLDYIYLALPVTSENLERAISGLTALGVVGSNVTVPHKQQVHDLIDKTTDDARIIGAVNTLVFTYEGDECTITGDNTDIQGFIDSLELYRPNLIGTTVTIFGSGGAARAVSYAILREFQPERLTFVVRDIEKGLVAADVLNDVNENTDLSVVSFDQAGEHVRKSRFIVNATPVGMTPDSDNTPWPTSSDFHSGQLVYDLIYAPLKTKLLSDADGRGAETLNGLDMLIRQADDSYRQWTGQPMDDDAVRAAIENYLRRRL